MRRVIEDKLRLDGVAWDELVLKDNMGNLMRGRFKAVRNQVGYKLPVLLESRLGMPVEADETLFGDDAEADAFVYSLYADILSGRVDRPLLEEVIAAAELYPDEGKRILELAEKVPRREAVRRIFINLDRLTPPSRFAGYGPRLVPIYNSFQSALVLLADGALTPVSVIKVAVEMVQQYGYNLISLSNSFQDLLRRGIPVGQLGGALAEALTVTNPLLTALFPAPDIIAAFAGRVASLGAVPPPHSPGPVDFRALIDDARPRHDKKRKLNAD
jgi:hypothetical protein